MKKISLTQGKFALVDDYNFEWLSQWNWYAQRVKNNRWYAAREDNGTVLMHRYIAGVSDREIQVDHKNGNGLDNREGNIRKCTHSENSQNKGKQKNNKSGYKGVSWHRASKKWFAQLKKDKKLLLCDVFDNKIDAARAYDKAARKYHGEFAFVNFKE